VAVVNATNTNSVRYEADQDVALVGRQPICAADGSLQAYELLFRNPQHTSEFTDGNRATSTVLLNTFAEIGLDRVVGNYKAFVNLTRDFLVGDHTLPARPDRLVLEVLEDIEIDEQLIKGIRALKRQGFKIALDDVSFHPDLEPLLALADIVKVDLRIVTLDTLKEHCRQFRRWPVSLLAEKVETAEEYAVCKSLDFQLYQGFYLSKPNIMQRAKSKTNKLIIVQLLAEICAKQFSFEKVAEIVKQDAGMCCRFLRYVNSAYNGLSSIRSVDHALVMMGSKGIRAMTAMLHASGTSEVPTQCVASTLLRGQMCRLVGEAVLPEEADSLCTLGILSTLEVLLGEPIEAMIDELPITQEMRVALLSYEGVMGQILKAVIAYDMGDWGNAKLERVPLTVLRDAFLASLERTDEVVAALMAAKA
jgi:EAL and modified HD-GYP domain-containing signal transduction protein